MKNYLVREPLPDIAQKNLNSYPEIMKTLLYYRGLDTTEKAETFLNPNYERDLYDPFLLKDMDKAVERIARAIKNQEKILIYSDYDADGIPAAVVLSDFFKLIGYEKFDVYIPHRHTEGYGLHLEAIDSFKERKISLMITLDCGIVDHEEVARAREHDIDVIVTDHHVTGETIPEACAVVNAKQNDCDYPFKHLCGAGVAFKLVQALLQRINPSYAPSDKAELKEGWGDSPSVSTGSIRVNHPTPLATMVIKQGQEKWFLDMVGLATLSDMVPLVGENRVLAHYGLKVLRKSRRPGFFCAMSGNGSRTR